MRDLVPLLGEPVADLLHEFDEEARAIKLLSVGGTDPQLSIQPAEERFAVAIFVVVNFGDGSGLRGATEHLRKPGLKSSALAGGAGFDAGPRSHLLKSRTQAIEAVAVDQVSLIDDDDLGFLKLFAVDVADVRGEARFG